MFCVGVIVGDCGGCAAPVGLFIPHNLALSTTMAGSSPTRRVGFGCGGKVKDGLRDGCGDLSRPGGFVGHSGAPPRGPSPTSFGVWVGEAVILRTIRPVSHPHAAGVGQGSAAKAANSAGGVGLGGAKNRAGGAVVGRFHRGWGVGRVLGAAPRLRAFRRLGQGKVLAVDGCWRCASIWRVRSPICWEQRKIVRLLRARRLG